MITYEIAKQLVQNNPDVFFEKKVTVRDTEVSLFNYFLASYNDFVPEYATELRGLCFVHNNEGESTPFLGLHKFFNLNENESTIIDVVKYKKIKSVQEKLDGSIINFVLLPSGRVVAKSKMSFDSSQAISAQEMIDSNSGLYYGIWDLLRQGKHPIFEYVSPKNQVVVGYNETRLVLLQVRKSDGSYVKTKKLKSYADDLGVELAKTYKYSLEQMIEMVETKKNLEGWVIRFDDGFIKLKTRLYLDLHGTVSDVYKSVHTIATSVIDEKIDDIISGLPAGSTRDVVLNIQHATLKKYDTFKDNVRGFLKLLNENEVDRKFVYGIYGSHEEFPIVMKFFGKEIDEEVLDSLTKEFFRKKLMRNEKAISFIGVEL